MRNKHREKREVTKKLTKKCVGEVVGKKETFPCRPGKREHMGEQKTGPHNLKINRQKLKTGFITLGTAGGSRMGKRELEVKGGEVDAKKRKLPPRDYKNPRSQFKNNKGGRNPRRG